jgi:hypothetical protein
MPPSRLRRQQVHAEVQEQREIAPSVLAEQHPPPSLLDVIMEKILDQGQQGGDAGGWDEQQGGGGGGQYGGGGFQQQPPPQQQHFRARHPERPILCRAVLCGEIVSDAGSVRSFIEDACATATAVAQDADPLKGTMIANADALGIPREFMKVCGVFVELSRHFWAVLEAEPAYLHAALLEIDRRLQRGAAAKRAAAVAAAAAQEGGGDKAKAGGAGAAGGAAGLGGASKTALGGGGAAASSSLGAGGSNLGLQQLSSFDGAGNVHVAFYADDVVERLTHRWTTVDLSDAPTAVAGGEGQTPALDEYVVECVFSIGEQLTTQTSAGGGALGGTRGISALADTARIAVLAQRTLPRDDLTDKMKASGLFFTLAEFTREFCTAATAVPVMYTDLIHPIEPEMEY